MMTGEVNAQTRDADYLDLAKIDPAAIRYIKLGEGGKWARSCFERGELQFGYRMVPHELCVANDWGAVEALLRREHGRTQGSASNARREIADFYCLGSDCLWVTFAEGSLWWCFAAPQVISQEDGTRSRKVIGEWRNLSLTGAPLSTDGLSTRLTQVAAYRMTICQVPDPDYLLRRIRGAADPLLLAAHAARAQMHELAAQMIARLHWAEFEVLIDLLFLRGGWRRVSQLGGSMKDADLILEQPTIGENAFVQVKSVATQKILEQSVADFEASGLYDRFFFVCHSPKGELRLPVAQHADRRYHLWTGEALTKAAVTAGLFDWLMERTG